MSPNRLLAIARKEWIQLRRDPRSMILAFVLPIVLLVFFGYAISFDIDEIALAIVDEDRTVESRELIDAFLASGYFSLEEVPSGAGETSTILTRGRALAVLNIPPDFSRDLASPGRSARVQLAVDGSDANTATIAMNYADAIVGGHLAGMAGTDISPAFELEARTWYNPTLESRHMIVPGLIAVIMSIIAAMLTALTIAREWERGTMEQLSATPVTRAEVVLGKLTPYLAIGFVDVASIVAVGVVVFGTPFNGSVLLLAALTLLFLVGALGLGMFISAAVKSQVLATQVAMVATYLPAVLLSGFLFDIASMPTALQGVTYLVPARYFITVTRGILLKGVGMEVLWVQSCLMLGYAVLGIGLATYAFRKELDA